MNGLHLDTWCEFTQKACITAASNALMYIHLVLALLLIHRLSLNAGIFVFHSVALWVATHWKPYYSLVVTMDYRARVICGW